MKNFTFLFFLLSTLFISCKKETVFNSVTINDNYSISIPEYLSPSTGMHQQASAQYENKEKEFYLLVIDESKADMQTYDLDYDIDTYYKNIVSKPFKDFIQGGKISIPGRQTINGAKALIADIEGEVNHTQIFYKLAVIETPNKFYQVVVWTRADQKEMYEKDMLAIIESLKEIDKSAK
jgi:hypothetical protein